MLVHSPKGLYCSVGNFYIDPSAKVEHAVITHAHSDHARRGSEKYYCANSGIGLLRTRIGKNIDARGFEFGENFFLGGVQISFHPAGHILGSAQVRLEYGGEVWVASGDYKRESDPTCEPFEVVPCDVFITEATFGTPAYRWNKNADLGREIFDWYLENSKRGVSSLLFGYSLGKTQRLLGLLKPFMKKPIYCHPAAMELTECYLEQGVPLAETICLSKLDENCVLAGELFIGPQSMLESKYAQHLGANFETAFASGWMSKNNYGYNKGFLISDHADWDDLVRTIRETGAKRVYVQHRGEGALVRHLKTLGVSSFSVEKLKPIALEPQLQLF